MAVEHAAEVLTSYAEFAGRHGDHTAGSNRGFAFDFLCMTCHSPYESLHILTVKRKP